VDFGVKSGGISNKVHGMLTMHSKPRCDQCLFFWALMRTGCARLSLFGISYVEGRGVLNLSFSRVGSGVGVVVVGEESIERW